MDGQGEWTDNMSEIGQIRSEIVEIVLERSARWYEKDWTDSMREIGQIV